MNERIRELALQAEDYSYTEYAKKQTGYTREDLFKSKFAELIVRECLEQVRLSIPSEQTNDFEQGAKWAFEESVIVIEEHFGVEEAVEAALRAALAEDALERMSEDERRLGIQLSTHSADCWKWHHQCAIAKIERECEHD